MLERFMDVLSLWGILPSALTIVASAIYWVNVNESSIKQVYKDHKSFSIGYFILLFITLSIWIVRSVCYVKYNV